MTQIVKISDSTVANIGTGEIVKNGHTVYDEDGSHSAPTIHVQNFSKYSEDISQSNWAKTKCTIDGTDGIIANTENNYHFVNQNLTASANTEYTLIFKAKVGDKIWAYPFFGGNGVATGCYFDIENLTTGSQSPNVTATLIKESEESVWVEIMMQFNRSVDATYLRLYAAESNSDYTFAGDGSTVNMRFKDIQLREGRITDRANYPYVKTTSSVIDIEVS